MATKPRICSVDPNNALTQLPHGPNRPLMPEHASAQLQVGHVIIVFFIVIISRLAISLPQPGRKCSIMP